MIDFNNKVALITGASGSIGRACSTILHKLGAHVIISGTNQSKLSELKSVLQDRCDIKVCDMRNYSDCENMIKELEKLDILICCAGITRDNLAIRASVTQFEEVISTNLTSSFVLNKAAIQKMMPNNSGRIINISSVVGISGNPGQSNYCASKAGIIGMSKALAHEVSRRNITVNVIAPGFIATNMTDKLSDQQKEAIYNKIPMQKFGQPEDVANAAMYLASKQASYVTGQTLHVNGGMLMV